MYKEIELLIHILFKSIHFGKEENNHELRN